MCQTSALANNDELDRQGSCSPCLVGKLGNKMNSFKINILSFIYLIKHKMTSKQKNLKHNILPPEHYSYFYFNTFQALYICMHIFTEL